MWISTSAPIAIAPARRQRSTFLLASRIASSEPPRTKVSIVTSAGTTLTASPPLVMIGWMRIVSFSQKVSRWAAIAFIAIIAAFSALIPSCGRLPACAARPMKRICLTSAPFDDSARMDRVFDAVARAGMDHHRHVDIVEMAFGDELGLAEHELDLALGDARRPLLDIDELLGRHGEKDDLAGEMLGGLGIAEPDRRAQHPGDLGVVAATVRRPGGRIGERMLRGAQAVELADKGEPRPRRAAGEPALDAGQGEAGARRQAPRRSSARRRGRRFSPR